MHFTMKFETMKHGKNAVEIFVKWGLSWHGALAFYSVQSYVEPYVYDKRKETMYIYHINTLDNKQDSSCVSYLIEAILNCIKNIFPKITRVILQRDNTRLYRNDCAIFNSHAHHINWIIYYYYIHTEIGYCKDRIYWNFTTMMKIVCWCELQFMHSDTVGVCTELQPQRIKLYHRSNQTRPNSYQWNHCWKWCWHQAPKESVWTYKWVQVHQWSQYHKVLVLLHIIRS